MDVSLQVDAFAIAYSTIASVALTLVAWSSPRNPGEAFTSRTTGSSPRKKVRTAAAEKPEERDVVRVSLVLDGQIFEVQSAITDRKDMRCRIIVGMDVLARSGFLVNPRKGGERKSRRTRRDL